MQLDGLGKRYPSQLSGGQRQRVALARALAIEPRMLLLDEPFGALDAKVRKDLRRWLRELHDAMGITTVFVTHDQEEALQVADLVAVMNEGRIEQIAHARTVARGARDAFRGGIPGRVPAAPCGPPGQHRGQRRQFALRPGWAFSKTEDGPIVGA